MLTSRLDDCETTGLWDDTTFGEMKNKDKRTKNSGQYCLCGVQLTTSLEIVGALCPLILLAVPTHPPSSRVTKGVQVKRIESVTQGEEPDKDRDEATKGVHGRCPTRLHSKKIGCSRPDSNSTLSPKKKNNPKIPPSMPWKGDEG